MFSDGVGVATVGVGKNKLNAVPREEIDELNEGVGVPNFKRSSDPDFKSKVVGLQLSGVVDVEGVVVLKPAGAPDVVCGVHCFKLVFISWHLSMIFLRSRQQTHCRERSFLLVRSSWLLSECHRP